MFLKKLEIVGFKSFAERIHIDFVPGVTAVVGPNGSGKSNITDAIRWVLGEQSAKSLRGAKMEDVIFAGSDSRKPLNFAEVTLVLDNSNGLFPLDYTEISVSRRVFRSGESAYLLNGQQCRLKDINDVFMDSGLGKEAFSIISQGRVDEILNSRPEDRRSIFDEAAGVLKYKVRKRKAEHKLFETKDNLDRVLDILKELDTRIGPLKESAEAAETYKVLRDQIRETDVQLLNYDAFELRQQLLEKSAQIEQITEQQKSLHTEVVDVEQHVTDRKKQVDSMDSRLEQLQQQLVNCSAEAEKWEGRRLLSLEKQKNAAQQIERLHKESENYSFAETELKSKLETAQQQLVEAELKLSSITEEMNEIANMLKRSVRETEQQIESLKSTYIERLNEEATVRNDLKHIEERLEGEKLSASRNSEQSAQLKERYKQLQAELAEKKAQVDKLRTEQQETVAAYEQARLAQGEAEEQLAHQQQLMQQALNKQHEMQGRLRALQSMEADFSGFYSGVKEVLFAKKAGKLQGIDGAIAELITVEPKFTKAIDTALGASMQHISTATEADARRAITFLKQRNAGRATFLPRDIMKPRKIPLQTLRLVEEHPEFVGPASKLATTDQKYMLIIDHLLGNTLVVKTLEGASAIARLVQYRFRIVTLDGDVVNAGGSLTGGGSKGQTSVFTRKAELETLRQQLSQMDQTLQKATSTISRTKMSVAEKMHDTERLRKVASELQERLTVMDEASRDVTLETRTVQAELQTIDHGIRGAEHAESELIQKRHELLKHHEHVLEQLHSLQQEIEALERFASNRREEEETLTMRYNELREQAAIVRQQQTFEHNTIIQLQQELSTAEQRLQAVREELDYLMGHQDGEELSTDEIIQLIDKAHAEKKQVEQAIAENRQYRVEIAEAVQLKELKMKALQEKETQLTGKLNDYHVQISRLEVKFESTNERLLEEYGLYPDFEIRDEFQVDDARREVATLKLQVEQLGPVNLGAIEEYAEVAERHAFLTEQRNDLMEAKQTLHEAMNEMDEEMKTRFGSTFNAVQHRFRHVFKEMFGGGEADLVLTEPENLLETGVEIVARPPGKKLQSLSLLSGGERALTAIALLFAIIEVRPVPFCILDEVEAALDEANVVRYSKYLKKFSEKTQFIVITHRKGTMEGADVLYGITMQESGVSKLISVKLSEVPEEAIS